MCYVPSMTNRMMNLVARLLSSVSQIEVGMYGVRRGSLQWRVPDSDQMKHYHCANISSEDHRYYYHNASYAIGSLSVMSGKVSSSTRLFADDLPVEGCRPKSGDEGESELGSANTRSCKRIGQVDARRLPPSTGLLFSSSLSFLDLFFIAVGPLFRRLG